VDASGQRRFFTAPAPSPAEVEPILARIVRRAHALLAERDGSALDDDEFVLAQTLAAASRAGGAEAHAPGDASEPDLGLVLLPTRRKARVDGFDLDAEVCVKAHERDRVEHLCRYARTHGAEAHTSALRSSTSSPRRCVRGSRALRVTSCRLESPRRAARSALTFPFRDISDPWTRLGPTGKLLFESTRARINRRGSHQYPAWL